MQLAAFYLRWYGRFLLAIKRTGRWVLFTPAMQTPERYWPWSVDQHMTNFNFHLISLQCPLTLAQFALNLIQATFCTRCTVKYDAIVFNCKTKPVVICLSNALPPIRAAMAALVQKWGELWCQLHCYPKAKCAVSGAVFNVLIKTVLGTCTTCALSTCRTHRSARAQIDTVSSAEVHAHLDLKGNGGDGTLTDLLHATPKNTNMINSDAEYKSLTTIRVQRHVLPSSNSSYSTLCV